MAMRPYRWGGAAPRPARAAAAQPATPAATSCRPPAAPARPPPGTAAPRATRGRMRRPATDHVSLDVTHLPSALVIARFPQIYRFCLDHGLDITRQRIPVSPAAHYTMGGIRTNVWGETNIAGL